MIYINAQDHDFFISTVSAISLKVAEAYDQLYFAMHLCCCCSETSVRCRHLQVGRQHSIFVMFDQISSGNVNDFLPSLNTVFGGRLNDNISHKIPHLIPLQHIYDSIMNKTVIRLHMEVYIMYVAIYIYSYYIIYLWQYLFEPV